MAFRNLVTTVTSAKREALLSELSAIEKEERCYREEDASWAAEMAHATRLLRLNELKRELAQLEQAENMSRGEPDATH